MYFGSTESSSMSMGYKISVTYFSTCDRPEVVLLSPFFLDALGNSVIILSR
jgi:hypothetical protein